MKDAEDVKAELSLVDQVARPAIPSLNISLYPLYRTSNVLLCLLLLVFLYAVFLASSVCWLTPNTFNKEDGLSTSGPITATITMPLDHFNLSNTRTFENHYWMNDIFYKYGGPIFFYDAGEAGVSDRGVNQSLGDPSTKFAPVELAEKYHGLTIIWEHRFYGQSMPFAVSNVTGIALDEYEAYRYLTIEQALEDAIYFTKNFDPPGYSMSQVEAMRADRSPWIWIGGSYPGNRAAMIRVRNPDIFFASWASSAPVQAQLDNSVYFNPIQQSMPTNCSADVHAAITYADEVLVNGKEKDVELVRRAIWLANSANPWNVSFAPSPAELSLWNISQILSYPFLSTPFTFQAFGYERSLGQFCNHIETWNPSNFTSFNNKSDFSALSTNDHSRIPTPTGLAEATSSEHAFHAYLHALIQKSISDFSPSPNPPPPISRADKVSWTWQLCSQNAKIQVSQHPAPHNLISRFLNVSNQLRWSCHAMFPYAPAVPDVDAMLRYGGWRMRPNNVMFTNGELDPWRGLGVQSDRGINPDALERKSTRTVPSCGEPPEGDAVFGVVWEGEVHVSDLRTGREGFEGSPVERGLELFGRALDEWLPCFWDEKSEWDSVME
ncbi:putative extracellular serine carboxypeptidase [Hyphodiscus hymeniophilus]|uniref:Extracellular serine carboxypeptidase n=1 Tax=Hyphodiscus hymeniophilus TaxID=353542 RepID=A0A9P6VIF5_9HELO|nr:putative extracellular serine carboxypeptidase [Hyphodiscus hymeniophilus]